MSAGAGTLTPYREHWQNRPVPPAIGNAEYPPDGKIIEYREGLSLHLAKIWLMDGRPDLFILGQQAMERLVNSPVPRVATQAQLIKRGIDGYGYLKEINTNVTMD